MSTCVLVVASGRGERFGGDRPKQYLPLAGKPLLRRCLERFCGHPRIVQALLNDHRSRLAMALFLGTFSFSMFALRVIDSQSHALPGLTILVGYLLGH